MLNPQQTDKEKESADTSVQTDASSQPKRKGGFLPWEYARELWGDHRFWKQMTVVKGGIGIIATGALLIPTVLSMPFMLAASAVALTGVLLAAAVFSVGYGIYGLSSTCKHAKSKIKNKFNDASSPDEQGISPAIDAPSDDISLSDTRTAFQDMLLKKWPFKQIAASSVAQKIGKTEVWKKFSSFMAESDNLLDTLTVKNSAASVVIFGSILLTTQAVVLPLFIPIAIVAYSVASLGLGAYMAYDGLTSLKDQKEKKLKLEEEKKLAAALKLENAKTKKMGGIRFKFWQAKEVNTKTQEEPINDNKPTTAAIKNNNKQP